MRKMNRFQVLMVFSFVSCILKVNCEDDKFTFYMKSNRNLNEMYSRRTETKTKSRLACLSKCKMVGDSNCVGISFTNANKICTMYSIINQNYHLASNVAQAFQDTFFISKKEWEKLFVGNARVDGAANATTSTKEQQSTTTTENAPTSTATTKQTPASTTGMATNCTDTSISNWETWTNYHLPQYDWDLPSGQTLDACFQICLNNARCTAFQSRILSKDDKPTVCKYATHTMTDADLSQHQTDTVFVRPCMH